MFQSRLYLQKLFIMAVDFVLLNAALFFAVKIRFLISHSHSYSFGRHAQEFFALFVIWVIIFYLFDLHKLQKIKAVSFVVSNLLIALAVCLLISIAYFYLFPSQIMPKTLLALTGALALALLAGWRFFWSRVIAKKIKPRVAIVGGEQLKLDSLNDIINPAESHYQMVGFINIRPEQTLPLAQSNVLGGYQALDRIIREHHIDELVAAFNYYEHPQVTEHLVVCLSRDIKITALPIFYEQATGKVPVEHIDQVWLLSQLKIRQHGYEIFERLIDAGLAAAGLCLCAPVIPIIALAIKIDSRGSIIYSQIRAGRKNKLFRIYKFRTMVDNAEQQTGAVFAQKNDARVTRIGKFLRQTRLDEIPQLVNVLIGDMSMVGPRPERPEFVEQLKKTIRFYSQRQLVKPGLTGWAQVKYGYGSDDADSLIKLQYDLYYIKNRSLILYLITIIRTIRIMALRRGR